MMFTKLIRASSISLSSLKPNKQARTFLSSLMETSIENSTCPDYKKAILDLNALQSNAKTISLAKYKSPQEILPLFAKQINAAGVDIEKLNKLNIIHISGTKGKGSSCAYVESILRHNGLKTGFYNSPHLVNVTERIRINGESIENSLFCKYFRQIHDRLIVATKHQNITMPTYFSFLTILSFHIFIEEKVDCAVIEVGIGGEYDPTNIIEQPVACGISTIHYDHVNILGNSIKSIAWSKAGIAKENVPIFTVDQEHEDALRMIQSRAREKSCPVYVCKALECNPFSSLGIRGSAQRANASLAVRIAEYFLKKVKSEGSNSIEIADTVQTLETNFSDLPANTKRALTSCSWPGRCQMIRYPRIIFFLDGAHTKESMDNCIEWFKKSSHEEDPFASRILMANVIGERDKSEVLRPLHQCESLFDSVIFSTNRTGLTIDGPKSEIYTRDLSDKSMENVHSNALTWTNLCKDDEGRDHNLKIMPNTLESINFVLQMSKLNPSQNYHVLTTGSLHFVGAMLTTLTRIDNLLR